MDIDDIRKDDERVRSRREGLAKQNIGKSQKIKAFATFRVTGSSVPAPPPGRGNATVG